MSKDDINIEDKFQFIAVMSKYLSSDKYKRRIGLCLSNLNVEENKTAKKALRNSKSGSFEENRRIHRPDITADLLALFGSPSGLKFLTHDFDPNSNVSMSDIIEQSLEIINSNDYRFKIPGSLYSLLNGFINGPKWTDCRGEEHTFFLLSNKATNWIKHTPSLHLLSSDELGTEINSFRNTVRVSKPNLASIFSMLISKDTRLNSLSVHTDKLDKADFYTNVFWVTFLIFNKVLKDIAQRERNANVKIKYERSSWQEYRLYSIKITHVGSEANQFDEVKNKLMASGGALYNLMSSCVGYCDWSVEANFEGVFKRWRILDFRNLPETEDLNASDVEGFTHIFTFYKK